MLHAGPSLDDQRVGIVGVGHMGGRIARRVAAAGYVRDRGQVLLPGARLLLGIAIT
jgi:hypothetical protein